MVPISFSIYCFLGLEREISRKNEDISMFKDYHSDFFAIFFLITFLRVLLSSSSSSSLDFFDGFFDLVLLSSSSALLTEPCLLCSHTSNAALWGGLLHFLVSNHSRL